MTTAETDAAPITDEEHPGQVYDQVTGTWGPAPESAAAAAGSSSSSEGSGSSSGVESDPAVVAARSALADAIKLAEEKAEQIAASAVAAVVPGGPVIEATVEGVSKALQTHIAEIEAWATGIEKRIAGLEGKG